MGKPSIFSKDYEKQMKKRRNRILGGICILLIIIVSAAVFIRGTLKATDKDTKKVENTEVKKVETESNKKAETAKEPKVEKPEGYEVQLSDGKNITAVYEVKNGNKVFKEVIPVESNTSYSISPSGKSIVIFDNKIQSMILLDINGTKQDVTNPQYVSTSGTVIAKDPQISANPGYIWCSYPKFIDENNIAYISQLPWIGKTTKYVWIENLTAKTHLWIQGIEGENLKLGDLTDRGLSINVDGRTVFLTANGNVSQ